MILAGTWILTSCESQDWVRSKISFPACPQEPLLATPNRQKFAWFGHVTRYDSLSKTFLQGTLEDGQRRGRQRKCWTVNIKEWTYLPMSELFTRVSCRKKLEENICWIVSHVPPTTHWSLGWNELNWTESHGVNSRWCNEGNIGYSPMHIHLWCNP